MKEIKRSGGAGLMEAGRNSSAASQLANSASSHGPAKENVSTQTDENQPVKGRMRAEGRGEQWGGGALGAGGSTGTSLSDLSLLILEPKDWGGGAASWSEEEELQPPAHMKPTCSQVWRDHENLCSSRRTPSHQRAVKSSTLPVRSSPPQR